MANVEFTAKIEAVEAAPGSWASGTWKNR